MMNRIRIWLAAAHGGTPYRYWRMPRESVEGGAKQATNWSAISMFVVFVCATLGITYWAAKQTKSAAQFYSAGGGITGFQNGIAIAGDYMSAASFLGYLRPGLYVRL